MSTTIQSPEILNPAHERNYRPLLFAAAVLFAALTILYSAAWIYFVRRPVQVEIGIDTKAAPAWLEITNVYKNSPAEKAGLKLDDRIVAINGRGGASAAACDQLLYRTWLDSRPGDAVTLTVQRPGQAQPLVIKPVFRAIEGEGDTRTAARTVAMQILSSYPLFFAVVGLAVLFLRVQDRNAWLLALVFATFITAADLPSQFAASPPHLQYFLLAYRSLGNSVLSELFYFFFAVFPTRSPIDRKVPWLKWVLVFTGLCLGLGGYRTGNSIALPIFAPVLSYRAANNARIVIVYSSIVLGLISLLGNMFSAPSADDRRKLKVIFWGTLIGVTPAGVIAFSQDVFNLGFSFWLNFVKVMLLFLFPLSFAYAVVKHRVMDIPVLLKRSARYFVVERGFVFLILAISVGLTFWFGQAFSRYFSAGSKAAIPIGATFGVLMITGATQVHRRVRTRLDRAFFRSSYDAQQILEELAARTLTVTTREELAELLQQNIWDALHPQTMYVYLDNGAAQFHAYGGDPPDEAMTLSPKAEAIAMLAELTGPLELNPEETQGTQLEALQPECLVPIRGAGEGQLQGGMVLGTRLSEESYSAMDKRLLASVASQAGIAMRSITLAEKMAERMEAERRAEQEMQIARQVQSRLLPQGAPALKTLDCAGKCIQTRAVGGDYYDFLDLGSGRLGLVLADIAGKGISAALLMANLQANLRGQYALALEDIPRLIRSVNSLFFKNTESAHYATTFFAVYEDEGRRLRYVNCGHNPPMLLRTDGKIERLSATATVLGLFEEWDCNVVETELALGEVLVIYTDGVSEAGESDDGDVEEFGEERLMAAMRKYQRQPAGEILDAILDEVQQFSPDEQADDITLIVAKGK
jgi:sigma-B regulation protein RsbU (phosphoserine phosphatase)